MVQPLAQYNCTDITADLYNETICDFLGNNTIPSGNLTEIANETGPALAIGIMSILWICLTAF